MAARSAISCDVMHRDDVPIPEPCERPWESMIGDDVRRHCDACDHSVVMLSALTRDEATEWLARPCAGHRCVRYESDAAGWLRFADTPRPEDPERPVPRPIAGRLAPRPAPPPSPRDPGPVPDPPRRPG